MKHQENILLSMPNCFLNSQFHSKDIEKKMKPENFITLGVNKESKKPSFNNIISNQITSSETSLINKDENTSEEISPQLNYNYDYKNLSENEDFVKKEPIITQVTLTKFNSKINTKINNKIVKNIKSKEFEYIKNQINSKRNSNIRKNKFNHNKNNYSTPIIYNLKAKSNSKNNYIQVLTEGNDENIKRKYRIKDKINFNDNKILKYIDISKENNYLKNRTSENINYEDYKIKINDLYKKNEIKSQTQLHYKNNKNLLFKSRAKSKPNLKNFYLDEDISRAKKSLENTLSEKMLEKIIEENFNIMQKNEILKKELKKMKEYIIELNDKIKNYKKNNKKEIIEDMEKKIVELKNKIIEDKDEINNLKKIIELNNNEIYRKENIIESKEKELYYVKNNLKNNKMNQNENEKIFNEIKSLKILLSEKNDLIKNLQNNNKEQEIIDLKNINMKLQIETNELKNCLKIKDEELINIKNKYDNVYQNLENIKNDYENLYRKYIEQNEMIEIYINKSNENNTINNNSLNYIDSQIIGTRKNLLNNNDVNEKEKHRCANCGDSLNEKNTTLTFRDNNSLNYNNGKYENEKNYFDKFNIITNSELNDENCDTNNFGTLTKKNISRNKKKSHFYPTKLNIDYNNAIYPYENNNTKNYNNFTSNYFYNKNTLDIEEISNITYDNNQLIKSFNSNNNTEKLPDINFSDSALSQFPNIYTLVGSKIIGFNLLKKKFILINPIDQTNNLFNHNIRILRKYCILSVSLNNSLGFFILLNNYIFFYSPKNNILNIIAKLSTNHWNGGFISIKNNLYVISGVDTAECEMYSFDSKKIFNLPLVNYKRTNSGICNVNNEYIYALFGRNSDNSIERLNIINNRKSEQNWELIKLKNEDENILYLNNLQQFLSFYNEDNIIIIGGSNNLKNNENEILKFNISDNSLKNIGFINLKSFYLNQITFIDEEFFAIYDKHNGLHFFNKDLDQHVIFNFQI